MLIICDDESVPLGPEEIVRRPDHVAWVEYMDRNGVEFLSGERLRAGGEAATVRARDGEVLVSDGPFMETKEQVAGFVLIECADLDEAVQVAARHPFAKHGAVEVRPVWEG